MEMQPLEYLNDFFMGKKAYILGLCMRLCNGMAGGRQGQFECFHRFLRRVAPLIFVSGGRSHVCFLQSELHLAFHPSLGRSVYLMCAGFADDACDVCWRDAAARHDDDAPCCLMGELAQQGDAGFCRGGLSGSEHTLKAAGDDLFQCHQRRGGEVESP